MRAIQLLTVRLSALETYSLPCGKSISSGNLVQFGNSLRYYVKLDLVLTLTKFEDSNMTKDAPNLCSGCDHTPLTFRTCQKRTTETAVGGRVYFQHAGFN